MSRRVAADEPVTDWRDTIPGQRRRGKRWGWLALVVGFGAILAYAVVPWRGQMNFQDVTFETWVCAEPIPADASWKVAANSGCELADAAVDVQVMQLTDPIDSRTVNGATTTVRGVPTAWPELALSITVPQGTSGVLLADGEPNPPVPMRPLNGDRPGITWTQHFAPGDSTQFVLFIGPPQ